jgi:hypothetical protein
LREGGGSGTTRGGVSLRSRFGLVTCERERETRVSEGKAGGLEIESTAQALEGPTELTHGFERIGELCSNTEPGRHCLWEVGRQLVIAVDGVDAAGAPFDQQFGGEPCESHTHAHTHTHTHMDGWMDTE